MRFSGVEWESELSGCVEMRMLKACVGLVFKSWYMHWQS